MTNICLKAASSNEALYNLLITMIYSRQRKVLTISIASSKTVESFRMIRQSCRC